MAFLDRDHLHLLKMKKKFLRAHCLDRIVMNTPSCKNIRWLEGRPTKVNCANSIVPLFCLFRQNMSKWTSTEFQNNCKIHSNLELSYRDFRVYGIGHIGIHLDLP